MKTEKLIMPAKGFKGLKENWKNDLTTGFMVFLLALPLSLGIAKASGFPPAMGVLTAIIGGVFTIFRIVDQVVYQGVRTYQKKQIGKAM